MIYPGYTDGVTLSLTKGDATQNAWFVRLTMTLS